MYVPSYCILDMKEAAKIIDEIIAKGRGRIEDSGGPANAFSKNVLAISYAVRQAR
jgi:hypothetical protein